ncbi:ATP-binding protein [Streptosporangium carneum]|uniref:ATP-binding protein n=1 Tax=Streptosporangium carneum TaxID=47481 RepID=A0A9W6MBB8_9ACTN|nr:ATP-binding protein [Streptosporangium carneum]GLK07887.1 ATP-binding protein [Streptosporangium carneum]
MLKLAFSLSVAVRNSANMRTQTPWQPPISPATVSEDVCRQKRWIADDHRIVSFARDWATTTLADWGLQAVTKDAQICISELVTNALVHALGDPKVIDVCLCRWPTEQVTLVVCDEDSHFPIVNLSLTDPSAESGRGLFLITALADALWWHTTGTGKAIGCRFDLRRYGLAP